MNSSTYLIGETKVYLCTESRQCQLKIKKLIEKSFVATIRSLCTVPPERHANFRVWSRCLDC
jgi:hypothetical protein